MARATTGEVVVVNDGDGAAIQASDPDPQTIDLTQIPADALQAELKRRESIEKQRLEAIRQHKIATRNAENIRVAEHADVLLEIFQDHEPPYRDEAECSDDNRSSVDFYDSNIETRCPRCILLELRDSPWAWDVDNKFVFCVKDKPL